MVNLSAAQRRLEAKQKPGCGRCGYGIWEETATLHSHTLQLQDALPPVFCKRHSNKMTHDIIHAHMQMCNMLNLLRTHCS